MSESGDVAQRRLRLSPAKRALLERRLEAQEGAQEAQRAIPRLADRTDAPLSYAQERLWFAHQWDPEIATYNRPAALRLRGELHRPSLEQSLRGILRRHEVLSTSFPTVDGRPVQRLNAVAHLSLRMEDLTGLPREERLAEAKRRMIRLVAQPFALESSPLYRASLFRLDLEDHLFIFVTHHALVDGWSEVVFVNELCSLYDSYRAGEASPLPELPIQYADFAPWQRDQVGEEGLQVQHVYWRRVLEGDLPVLDLPSEGPRAPVQTHRGATQTLELSRDLIIALEAVSRREGVTLFMTMLAAFKVMLVRYTDQTDVIVGTLTAGRRQPETESLIGVFANTLALRTELGGNPTFRELLQRVRETCLGAYANQDLPFDMLVAELNPDRDLSRTPVFQVLFSLENLPDRARTAGEIEVTPVDLDTSVALFDVSVELIRREGEIHCAFVYNTDLVGAATTERMVGHYRTLLEGLVVDPGQRISDLPLLTEVERHRLLVEWNETEVAYPRDRCVHQLFEAQVKRTPELIAVVYEDESLTYRELNDRANQLARYLRKQGVEPDATVGLCVERSAEMLVGLLGILKAGGAYVPLNPSYPSERLAFMMADVQAHVLVTQKELLAQLSDHEAQVLCLDLDWEKIGSESTENLDNRVSADNLAYVIYTSGSTGKPKGVMIQHGSIPNLAAGLDQVVYARNLGSWLRISLTASLSFDATVKQMVQLLRGHALYVIPDDMRRDGQALLSYVADQGLDVLDCTPSQLRILLSAGLAHAGANAPALIIVGGEAVDDATWKVMAQSEVTTFFNLYGPTENTVVTTGCRVEPVLAKPSIGRPLANTQLYVLDQRMQPVPIGVPAELCIGGDGLARGYLRRPDLTAERFVPNPFGRPGTRLYRTGDLVRWSPDGNLEFLGRADHQVKVRGFRIELGEIETVLQSHPAVHQCVVSVLAGTPDDAAGGPGTDQRLVAYVVPSGMSTPSVSDLRGFLSERLPHYMLPTAYVYLDSLPVTPRGKVDREALPAPDHRRPQLEGAPVVPRTAVERKLADIWAQVLSLDQVGIHDDFFELGGHSLLATQIVSRIRDTFHIDLPLRSIFESPTIAGLTALIEQSPSMLGKSELSRAELSEEREVLAL